MKLEVSVELTLLVALAALVEETDAMLETLALLEETLEILALLEDATLDTLTLLEETLDALALLEETLESLALLEDATLDTLTALEDATLDTLALLEALAALLETFTPVVVPALTLLDVNGKPPGKPLGKPPGKPEGNNKSSRAGLGAGNMDAGNGNAGRAAVFAGECRTAGRRDRLADTVSRLTSSTTLCSGQAAGVVGSAAAAQEEALACSSGSLVPG